MFAVNHRYKRFRDGRLFRLSDLAPEETRIDPDSMTDQDRAASTEPREFIESKIDPKSKPPLVDAFGSPISP